MPISLDSRAPDFARRFDDLLALKREVSEDVDAAARAIVNLGRLTRGVLYLSALTERDWRQNCDRTRTDRSVNLRPAEWYGARLRRWFRPSGAGFWIRRGPPLKEVDGVADAADVGQLAVAGVQHRIAAVGSHGRSRNQPLLPCGRRRGRVA